MRTNLIKKIPKVESTTEGIHDMVIAFNTTGITCSYLD